MELENNLGQTLSPEDTKQTLLRFLRSNTKYAINQRFTQLQLIALQRW